MNIRPQMILWTAALAALLLAAACSDDTTPPQVDTGPGSDWGAVEAGGDGPQHGRRRHEGPGPRPDV